MSESNVTVHHLTVSRTARYHALGTPGEGVHDVWFVLHGYGQLAASFIKPFEAIAAPGRLVVAPEALSRFYLSHEPSRIGASWMTAEDRHAEIDDYLAYLDAVATRIVPPGEAVRLTVLGFSQGAATASRWAVRGAYPVDRLILWGGSLAHDLDLQIWGDAFRGMELVYVIGNRDAYITPERLAAERDRLDQHAVPCERIAYTGGHRLRRDVLIALADGVQYIEDNDSPESQAPTDD